MQLIQYHTASMYLTHIPRCIRAAHRVHAASMYLTQYHAASIQLSQRHAAHIGPWYHHAALIAQCRNHAACTTPCCIHAVTYTTLHPCSTHISSCIHAAHTHHTASHHTPWRTLPRVRSLRREYPPLCRRDLISWGLITHPGALCQG